jgi:hypothetical protein
MVPNNRRGTLGTPTYISRLGKPRAQWASTNLVQRLERRGKNGPALGRPTLHYFFAVLLP